MKALLVVCLVGLGVLGCGDKESDAVTDAGHGHAGGQAHDAGTQHDSAAADEDAGHAAVDGDRACDLLCEDREKRGVAEHDACVPKCLGAWPSLSHDCQLAALDYGKCAAAATCSVVAECCYSEVGRYADQCPLDFQQ